MKVSAEDLQSAATKAEDYYGKIEGIQKALYGEVDHLMAGWTGDAARAYAAAFKRFDEEFTQVQNSLDTLHQKLGATSLSYARNEAEQSEMGKKVLSMINSTAGN